MMVSTATMLYLYVESPLHAGVGVREDTVADLPIQRDEVTGNPRVQASSLKGAFRRLCQAAANAADVVVAFGPEPEQVAEAGAQNGEAQKETAFAGALVLGDAHLLLFPARSLVGVFTWVTSADALARFQRDGNAFGCPQALPPLASPPMGTAWVAPGSRVLTPKGQLVIEELTYQAQPYSEIADLGSWLAQTAFPQGETHGYWRDRVRQDVVVLPEADFRFLTTNRTEIIQRIRIDPETGTAAEGALWSEEFLPTDSLLYVPVGAQPPARPGQQLQSAQDVLDWFRGLLTTQFQLGGGRTLGRGFVYPQWEQEEQKS
jgi:CRISPR-associated protein Cmr4